MRFTLITATLNSSATLPQCLASVAAQRNVELEHLIIDGGSTDGTLELIRKSEKTSSTRLICSEPDSGLYDAWNKALNHISGDWILFLGSDDWLVNPYSLHKAYIAINFLKSRYSSQDLPFIAGICLGPDGRQSGLTPQSWAWKNPEHWLQRWRGILPLPHHPSILHSANIFKSGARFDESYRVFADKKLLWLHHCNQCVSWINVPLITHNTGGISQNNKSALLRHKELSRLLKEIGRERPIWIESLLGIKAGISQLVPHRTFW